MIRKCFIDREGELNTSCATSPWALVSHTHGERTAHSQLAHARVLILLAPYHTSLRRLHHRDSLVSVRLLHSPGIAQCAACTTGPHSSRSGSVWDRGRGTQDDRGQDNRTAAPAPRSCRREGRDFQRAGLAKRTRGRAYTRGQILGSRQAFLHPPKLALDPAFFSPNGG